MILGMGIPCLAFGSIIINCGMMAQDGAFRDEGILVVEIFDIDPNVDAFRPKDPPYSE